MGMQCATINMLYPAYIASIDIYIVPMDCVEPCDVYAAITWLNYGDITGQFTPGLIVDGVLTTFPSVSLDGGEAVSLAFDISGLMAGTHTIQASPNTGTALQTVNVYPVYSSHV